MINRLKQLLRNNIIDSTAKAFIVIWVGSIVILAFKWQKLPPQMPLFYSLPRGEEQLTSPLVVFLLPFISLLLFLIHIITAANLFEKEKLAQILITLSGFINSVVLILAFIKIVFLVT